MIVAGLLIDRHRYSSQGSDAPVVRALYWWLAGIVLTTSIALFTDSGNAKQHLEAASRFALLGFFVPVGMVIGASTSKLQRVMALATVGFVAARLEHPETAQIKGQDWLDLSDRLGLGLPPLALGALSAFLLLAILVFLPRLIQQSTDRRYRATVVLLALAFAAALAECLLVSLSRGAWLAISTSLVALIIIQLINNRRAGLLALTIVLITAAVVVLPARDAIVNRVSAESEQFEQLINAEFDDITAGHGQGHKHSVGSRVVMIREALDLWTQRPLFGHGPAAPELSMRNSDNPFLRYYSDFHNAILNILVGYGVLGLVLFLAPPMLTLRAFSRRTKASSALADVRLFVGLSVWMLVLSAVLNYRLLNYDWRFWYWLVLGTAYGFAFRRDDQRGIESTS